MIIVEGPDGAGKTTLVNQIAKEHGLQVGVRGVKDRDRLYESTRRDTWSALDQCMRGNELPRIWDRLYFSELIYAPLTGRRIAFTFREQVLIPKLFRVLGVPVIFCLPSKETVLDNVKEDDQMEGVLENISEIYDQYDSLYKVLLNYSPAPPAHVFRYAYDSAAPGAGGIQHLVHRYIDHRNRTRGY